MQSLVAVALVAVVCVVSVTQVANRALVAVLAAVLVAAAGGLGTAVGPVVPEVLVATASLMVLAGFVKRSGLASWLVLRAVRLVRGRPIRILVLLAVLTFALGALLGPTPTVFLLLPVALLIGVELDVPPLPFVVVLTWSALLGGASVLTAHPGNLWVAAALDIDAAAWSLSLLPFTLLGLAVTALTSVVLFRRSLRTTNERRARVLEFDEARSVENRPLLVKTVAALVLVVAGVVWGPLLGLSPAVVLLGAAALLTLTEGRKGFEAALGEIDASTLLFYGGLMVVVGTVGMASVSQIAAGLWVPDRVTALGGSALLGALVNHGTAVGVLVPLLGAWSAGTTGLWAWVVLGSTLGAGVTAWGAVSNQAALNLARSGNRFTAGAFVRTGLVLAGVNLAALATLGWLLGR